MAHFTAQTVSDWLGVFGHHFLGRGGGGPISLNKVRVRETDGSIVHDVRACPLTLNHETETCPETAKSFSKKATFSFQNASNELHVQKATSNVGHIKRY